MNLAVISMNFLDASKHRDNMFMFEKKLKEMS